MEYHRFFIERGHIWSWLLLACTLVLALGTFTLGEYESKKDSPQYKMGVAMTVISSFAFVALLDRVIRNSSFIIKITDGVRKLTGRGYKGLYGQLFDALGKDDFDWSDASFPY